MGAERRERRALHTSSKAWRLIRNRILNRDLWRCQGVIEDGVTKQKRKCGRFADEVDHINGDAMNNDDVNLQALCASCHSAKTARENRGFGNSSKPVAQQEQRKEPTYVIV